jgi:GGDEF domain-containing protein
MRGGGAAPLFPEAGGGSAESLPVDPLTGFGTRSALLADLDRAAEGEGGPTLLAVFGLEGYDEYVTLFGSLAGRTLLVKLGARLTDALEGDARCYRPRHDEFALLVGTPIGGVAQVLDRAVAALRERAASVAVSAAWGAAMLPDEAGDALAALKLADSRLASNAPRRKRRNRRSNPGP